MSVANCRDEFGQTAIPTLKVRGFAVLREIAVREVHDRVAAVSDEHHLHGAAAGRHFGVIGDAPREDHPMWCLHLDEAASGGDPAEVQGEASAWLGVQVDPIPDPSDHE